MHINIKNMLYAGLQLLLIEPSVATFTNMV